MPKLAANLSTLFLELPMPERPAAAARAGFKGVELKFLDPHPSDDFLKAVRSNALEMVMFNSWPGELSNGDLGLASDADQRVRFEAGISKDLEFAAKLGTARMHVLAGRRDPKLTTSQQIQVAVNAYRWAAAQAALKNITILIEPLAPSVIPDYLVSSLEIAVQLVDEVASPNFKILFDFFHMQLAGGDVVSRFKAATSRIGHVQIAAAPSRLEPDAGELCLDFVLNELDHTEYAGWVGCEYSPKTSTLAGLGWAKKWLTVDELQKPKTGAIMPDTKKDTDQISSGPSGYLLGRIWDPHVGGPCIVTIRDDLVFDITSQRAPLVSDICELDDPIRYIRQQPGRKVAKLSELFDAEVGNLDVPHLLAPCDLQAVKACGVTFAKSMLERVIEEQAAGDPAKAKDIRARVQAAVGDSLTNLRAGSPEAAQVKSTLVEEGLWSQYLEVGIGPDAEVFSKAQVLSSVGYGAKIGLHPSSNWNNPEPELVLVVSSSGRIVGASLGNDVNLRDIEGRSALLLSKAKDNNASCAIGPFIRLLDGNFTLDHLRNSELSLRIDGADGYLLTGNSSMAQISRDPEDLVRQTIGRHHQYPDGLMLFLGTAFAPTQDRDVAGEGFTHKTGDTVSIACQGLGELQNIVDLSTHCPKWTFGVRALMTNLARRGLI